MTNKILSKHIGVIAVGSGLIGASIYLLMINVTLAHIEVVSGHVPFDMRPFGYGSTDAATLLEALGVEGRVLSQSPDRFGHTLSINAHVDFDRHDLLVWATHDKQKTCPIWHCPFGG